MSSCLRHYFVLYELNTLDACWIARSMCGVTVVDAESFQPSLHGRDAYIHDHCLTYHHNFAIFYQLLGSNLFTHRNNFYLERKPLVKHMPPGSIFHLISFRSIILVSYLLSLQYFTFRSINQKYYFTVYPSLSDLTLRITVKGLRNPLSRWLQVGVCLCRYSVACCVVSYWIDTLVLKTEGNTYATLLHHPFLFKGKTNASSRGSTSSAKPNHTKLVLYTPLNVTPSFALGLP